MLSERCLSVNPDKWVGCCWDTGCVQLQFLSVGVKRIILPDIIQDCEHDSEYFSPNPNPKFLAGVATLPGHSDNDYLYKRIMSSTTSKVFCVAQTVKNLPATQETQIRFLGQEDPLEKGMAVYSSILAWRIPRTEEPGSLQSMGLQRVGHDWATNTSTPTTSKHFLTYFHTFSFSFFKITLLDMCCYYYPILQMRKTRPSASNGLAKVPADSGL